MLAAAACLALFAAPVARAAPESLTWASAATGEVLPGRVYIPSRPAPAPTGGGVEEGVWPAAVYLKNLSIPRLGRDADERIRDDLLKEGILVLELDYKRHPKAVGPGLQADVLKLRRELNDRKLLAAHKVDLARVFVLAEGFRLKRGVEFARDGERVLAMDIMYPAHPAKPVPALMEITCDNVNRMGSGSLVFCHDTLLEGGMFAGFAVAMADHPVRPPYKGLDDPMPELIHRLKAAVRTLRAAGAELGLNGRIGVVGFSRGSNMAALLAATNGMKQLEGEGGPHAGVSSDVQAAMAHGGRFDYTRLRDDDPMLARFEKAWGKREADPERWARHGAVSYLLQNRERAAPMFLNTSDAEAPEFRDQLAGLAERLTEAGVEHVCKLDADGRGHRVSTDPKTLAAVYAFFTKHLGD
jgi:dienelactone hydrolase